MTQKHIVWVHAQRLVFSLYDNKWLLWVHAQRLVFSFVIQTHKTFDLYWFIWIYKTKQKMTQKQRWNRYVQRLRRFSWFFWVRLPVAVFSFCDGFWRAKNLYPIYDITWLSCERKAVQPVAFHLYGFIIIYVNQCWFIWICIRFI